MSTIVNTMSDSPHDTDPQGIYLRLRNWLIRDPVVPNQKLSITDIADTARVSNTPVREALFRLWAEGMVQLVPSRGFFTNDIREADLLGFLRTEQALVEFTLRNRLRGDALIIPPPTETDPGHAAVARMEAALDGLLTPVVGLQAGLILRAIQGHLHLLRVLDGEDDAAVDAMQRFAAAIEAVPPATGAHRSVVIEDYYAGFAERLPALISRRILRAYRVDGGHADAGSGEGRIQPVAQQISQKADRERGRYDDQCGK